MNKDKDILQIKKYLNGELNGNAMHLLERRALDDSFLADALEGFEQIGEDQQLNLDDLTSRVQQRIHDKKVKRMIPWGSLSIVASILITIGAGIWLFKGRQKNKDVPPLYTHYVEPEKQDITPEKKEKPKLTLPLSPMKVVTLGKKDNGIGGVKQTPINTQSKKIVDTVALLAIEENMPLASRNISSDTTKDKFYKLQKDSITSRELIANNINAKKDVKNAPNSRSNGRGTVSAGSLMQSPMQTTSVIQDGKIVTDKVRGTDEQPNNGGFIGGKVKAVDYAALKKNRNPMGENAHPHNGWQAYNEYLKKNAQSPDGKTGEVRVSLMVDTDGGLNQLKIIKGLSDAANQKAIELIKNGPVWVGGTSGKPEEVKLTVKFNK